MKRKEHNTALFFQKAFKPSFYGIPDKFLQLLPGRKEFRICQSRRKTDLHFLLPLQEFLSASHSLPRNRIPNSGGLQEQVLENPFHSLCRSPEQSGCFPVIPNLIRMSGQVLQQHLFDAVDCYCCSELLLLPWSRLWSPIRAAQHSQDEIPSRLRAREAGGFRR